MKTSLPIILFLCALLGASCVVPRQRAGAATEEERAQQAFLQSFRQRNRWDSEAWRAHRESIAAALGQRDYEAAFGRAFDSLVVALGTLEVKVENMERASGFIVATGMHLPPAERRVLMAQWAAEKDINLAALGSADFLAKLDEVDDSDIAYNGMYTGWTLNVLKSCSIQLVRIDDGNTRVKVRFTNVLYPEELAALYQLLWRAVDKQIFVDTSVDGPDVHKRE